MMQLLKQLCLLNGTSGREERVREYILQRLSGKADVTVDPLGNVLAFVKGRQRAKKTVMFTAHMDEVGFIVTYITDEGYLKFSPVGGVDDKVIVGRAVSVGEDGIPGVIGIKAIHLTDKSDSGKVPSVDAMYIDIGAKDKAEAETKVHVGDAAYFISDFKHLGTHKIKAKAIDDRFGCAVMLDMIDQGVDYDCWFCFLVQEEVGLRGAGPAAFRVKPDYAVVLEATTAADVAGVKPEDSVCIQGNGAVVSFMDRSTVYNRTLFQHAFRLAAEHGIACQTKTTVAGGNDAGAIHKANGGVYTLTVSLPCRYIHSATSVADVRDMVSCRALAPLLLNAYADDTAL